MKDVQIEVREVGLYIDGEYVKASDQATFDAPFGGFKKSGIGREGGHHSMEFFTEAKNICISLQ